MPSDGLGEKLDRPLGESAALRETSEALARDAAQFRAEIEQAPATERRQKPRVKRW